MVHVIGIVFAHIQLLNMHKFITLIHNLKKVNADNYQDDGLTSLEN